MPPMELSFAGNVLFVLMAARKLQLFQQLKQISPSGDNAPQAMLAVRCSASGDLP